MRQSYFRVTVPLLFTTLLKCSASTCAHWCPFSWWCPRPPPSSPMPRNGSGANYHQRNVLVLLMGVIKKNISPEILDGFLLLLCCLHFTNSAQVSHHDPLHKIKCIFTAITSSFRRVFVLYKDLCVDESLMKCKGRLAFRQYIPTKRSRFGVKFFVLCAALTEYVQDMVIYTGSTTDICYFEGLGISGSVVMTLLAPYLGKGRVLYVDNWYSSPSLFQQLFSHGTGACGTVRANRTGMPVFTGKMVKGQVECKQNGTQLVVK